MNSEFSSRTRSEAIRRFRTEIFDLLIVGGGITGAACARDAASRGLKVALVEKSDFASGTSSASSKLIHGGLRYLENFEFKLVFEALSERSHLVRTAPNLVRWLKFYLPVYETDARGKGVLSLGLWLYDFLSLFRAPHFHKRLSRDQMLREVPGVKAEGLVGGFTYYDASMWDDVMVVDNVRAASQLGSAVANYVEAVKPIWENGAIRGFECMDRESEERFSLLAKRTLVCAGPFTDHLGSLLSEPGPELIANKWHDWLEPSRGVHLVFDKTRFPVPGAMLMTHPKDGRVSFVIPREDFGSGVVVVGTTDAPSPKNPDEVRADDTDVDYLLDLLGRYFPALKLARADVISTYVGVRPLVDPSVQAQAAGANAGGGSLQKVSREHHIGRGPGGTVFVAGGKYTTARLMALEIVDFALRAWEEDYWGGRAPRVPVYHRPQVDGPANRAVSVEAMASLNPRQGKGANRAGEIRPEWIARYGADAARIADLAKELVSESSAALAAAGETSPQDPPGFPGIEAEFLFSLRYEMAVHLEDFAFRRQPLYLSRQDHGGPWLEALSRVWARELGRSEPERRLELERLQARMARRERGFHG